MLAFVIAMFLLLAAIVLAAFGIGVRFVWRGLRGEVIGVTPYCRCCDYDLSGLPSLMVCPECGHSLDGPWSVKHGRYRLRRNDLCTGLSLIMLSSTPFTLAGFF